MQGYNPCMRTFLFFLGSTVGSVAFQISVALYPHYLQQYSWVIKYVWILWGVIWLTWAVTNLAFWTKLFGGGTSQSETPALPGQAFNVNFSPVISQTVSSGSQAVPQEEKRPFVSFDFEV